MKFSKIIEMDIWSNFGCFSKPFSTTGGTLTYLVPPKTVVIGMIGAVLGYNFDDFSEDENNIKIYDIEKLFDVKISLQPLFDLKTKKVTFNRVSGTTYKTKIQNIHQDVLINPYFKLFISFPDGLKDEEELFLKRIKNNETVYNLYMGRNEFPLNYKLCDIIDYESEIITKDTSDDFFSNNEKVYGLLNRKNVDDVTLKSIDEKKSPTSLIYQFNDNINEEILKPYYEYIIPEYPIKRSNFTDFTFSEVSFYSTNEFKECFFSKISLKDDCSLELTKIGDNEWISMI